MLAIVRRDLSLALRRKNDSLSALFFFIVVASLFPLGIGPEPTLLAKIAPGRLWIAALLAAMPSLGRLFADDFQDGTLDQLVLTAIPLPLAVLSKTAAHWISSGLVLTIASPILAIQFNLDAQSTGILVLSLLIGTPLLSLIGSIGAALTLATRGGGHAAVFAGFAAGHTSPYFWTPAQSTPTTPGLPVDGHFYLLGAMLAIALFFAPIATAASLRIAVE